MEYQRQCIVSIHPSQLRQHPRNQEFFSDITGRQWDEFKADIQAHGILHPIIATMDGVIISGCQRWRAAKELGLEYVNVIQRNYDNEDAEVLELIYCNTHQRFTDGDNDMLKARRVAEVQRICGTKPGRPSDKKKPDKMSLFSTTLTDGTEVGAMTNAEIASMFGLNERGLQRLVELMKLHPDLQQALIDGELSSTTGARIIGQLDPKAQEALLENVGVEALSKLTIKELKEKIPVIKEQEERIQELEEALQNSHGQVFDESELDKVIKERDELKRREEKMWADLQAAKKENNRQLKALRDQHKAEAKKLAVVSQVTAAFMTLHDELNRLQRMDIETLRKMSEPIQSTYKALEPLVKKLS